MADPAQTTARRYAWNEIDPDEPVPGLHRRRLQGERILVAKLSLEKGCTVARHSHPNEQIVVVLSGRIALDVGEAPGERVVLGPGEVLHLPADLPHGAEALEDTELFDLLSPPGPMGVDAQR